jgi:hypothetical protein
MIAGMIPVVDIGVYTLVFFIAIVTASVLYYSSRKFLKGEFKDFINWIMAAAGAFTLGSFLNMLYVIFSMVGSAYLSALLVTTGVAFILTSVCFVRAALLLLGISKVFGFAAMEKDFENLLKKKGKRKPQKAK